MIAHSFGVTIPADFATPALRRTLSGLRGSKNLARYGGRAVQKQIGEHVREYAGNHHATAQSLGAQPTGFYSDAYEQVTAADAVEFAPGQAIINLPRNAFARAFKDVTILPGGGKKYLTFAAVGYAYGRRAASFGNLTFGMAYDPNLGRTRPALVEAMATSVKIGRQRKDGTRGIKALSSSTGRAPVFWLVRKAVQKQDRSLLPTPEQMQAAGLEGMADYIVKLIEEKGGTA